MYWCLKLAFRSCLLYHPSNVYEQLIRTRAFDFVSSVSANNCHFSFVFSDRRLLEDELYYAKKREVGCLHWNPSICRCLENNLIESSGKIIGPYFQQHYCKPFERNGVVDVDSQGSSRTSSWWFDSGFNARVVLLATFSFSRLFAPRGGLAGPIWTQVLLAVTVKKREFFERLIFSIFRLWFAATSCFLNGRVDILGQVDQNAVDCPSYGNLKLSGSIPALANSSC